MACAFGGASPILMSLTGVFVPVPCHHLARGLRQIEVEQVRELLLRNFIIKWSVAITILNEDKYLQLQHDH